MDFKTFKKDADKFRNLNYRRKIELTPKQEEFIIICRKNKNPVSTRNMSILWEQLGWGKLSKYGIETRIEKLKAMGKL